MSKRQLHLNVNILSSGSHPAAWRAPDGRRFGYVDIEHYQETARLAERGTLDAVFLADALAIAPDPRSGPSWALDPIVTIAGMAAVTEKVGFVASVSTTFNHPYNVARIFNSLDHTTRGRIAWNIVASYDERAAPNFGLDRLPVHEDRYARAAEFTDVVTRLWDSWEDEALVGDRDSGLFADPALIHRIDHQGQHFSVQGPLQLPRSPQGRSLLVQAGGSGPGRDLGARYADAIFTVQQVFEEAAAFYLDVKARVRARGRNPDDVHILPGLSLVVASTEAEAKARKRDLDAIIGDETALKRFAGRLGVDHRELDLDKPVPPTLLGNAFKAQGSQGFADATIALARDPSLTVRQIIDRGGGAHRILAGGPEQIADTMEAWFRGGAADGFNVMFDVFPTGLRDFVDHVVPELRRRGLFRQDYEGSTLRSHYGLARPASIFSAGAAPRRAAAG